MVVVVVVVGWAGAGLTSWRAFSRQGLAKVAKEGRMVSLSAMVRPGGTADGAARRAALPTL